MARIVHGNLTYLATDKGRMREGRGKGTERTTKDPKRGSCKAKRVAVRVDALHQLELYLILQQVKAGLSRFKQGATVCMWASPRCLILQRSMML